MSLDKKISAIIAQETAEKLQATADELNKSQSEVIRLALDYYLKNLENQKAWLTLALTK